MTLDFFFFLNFSGWTKCCPLLPAFYTCPYLAASTSEEIDAGGWCFFMIFVVYIVQHVKGQPWHNGEVVTFLTGMLWVRNKAASLHAGLAAYIWTTPPPGIFFLAGGGAMVGAWCTRPPFFMKCNILENNHQTVAYFLTLDMENMDYLDSACATYCFLVVYWTKSLW